MRATLAALGAAMVISASAGAMAQTSTAPSVTAPSTEIVSPAPKTTEVVTPGGKVVWYSHDADEMRASKLIGAKVLNNAKETVGDINDVILSSDGKVAAVVIGVGGFLGLGEHEVAVNFDTLHVARDADGKKLVVSANMTKDGLKSAPVWRGTEK